MKHPHRSVAAAGIAFTLLLTGASLPAAAAGSAHTLNCQQPGEKPVSARELPLLRSPEPLLDAAGVAAKAYAGFYVEQAVAQHGDTTYAAFYNADKVLTVAHRTGTTGPWTFTQPRLVDGSRVILDGDTHNSIALTVDAAGAVHMIANVNSSAMSYWRSAAGDPTTLSPADHLVITPSRNEAGARLDDEGYAAYPRFIEDKDAALHLMWRAGWSNGGKTYLYAYDTASGRWSNPQGTSALLDGWSGSVHSPYPDLPRYNPADGYYYLSYTWQDDGSAASTSTVNIIRSKDLRSWSSMSGSTFATPIRYGDVDALVENVPEGSGLRNGNVRTGFDAGGRATVAYVRERAEGTALTLSRRDGLDKYWLQSDVSNWRGHNDLSDPSDLSRLLLGTGTELRGEGANSEEMSIFYECNGESRVLRAGHGPFNGASVFRGDSLQAEGILPAALRTSDFAGSGYTLTFRTARTETNAGTLVLKWEAGPMISTGASPDPARFPAGGSTLLIATVGR